MNHQSVHDVGDQCGHCLSGKIDINHNFTASSVKDSLHKACYESLNSIWNLMNTCIKNIFINIYQTYRKGIVTICFII